MFTRFILHSREEYYGKELLLMIIYKIANITFPKKSISNSCIAKKLNSRNKTVSKFGKRLMNLVKTHLNHNEI